MSTHSANRTCCLKYLRRCSEANRCNKVQFKEHKYDDACYLTNQHDFDQLSLDWIKKTDAVSSLLYSHKPSSESVRISYNISELNASDVTCSHNDFESNASSNTYYHKISESHSFCPNGISTPRSVGYWLQIYQCNIISGQCSLYCLCYLFWQE